MRKIFTIILLSFISMAVGQNTKKLERIKALRVSYITNKLDLSAIEAEKFWPVFNDFDAKQIELRMQKRIFNSQLNNPDKSNLSEKEMSKLLENSEKIEDELQLNRKAYIKNLKEIISPKKIILLKQAEEEFKKELINKIRQNKKIRN